MPLLLVLATGQPGSPGKRRNRDRFARNEVERILQADHIDILSFQLTDRFVVAIEDESIYGKAGYVTHSADQKVRVRVGELPDLKIRMPGDTAIVSGA